MSTAKQTSLIRRTGKRAVAASGITAAALYGWWQTIDAARTPNTLPETQLSQTLALGRVTLTPLSVQLRRPGASGTPAQLVLSATVENVTSTTQEAPFGYPPRLVQAQIQDDALAAPDITLLRDHEALRQLQPRMSENIEIAWSLPANWKPGEVSLTFFRQQFKLKDNLYGRSNWLGYSAIAQLQTTPEAQP